MKKVKLGFGFAAIAVVFVMAFATAPNANADILRATSSPTSPIISRDDCDKPSTLICGYLFTDVNDQVANGPDEGTYIPR